jgi:hypothetical protein
VAFSPDGRILASGASDDNTVQLLDVTTRRNIAALAGHFSGVIAVTFSPDGRTLATGTQDGAVRLWDVAEKQVVASLKEVAGVVHSLAYAPDGRRLAVGYQDGTVGLWDVAARRPVARLSGHTNYVNAVTFSPDGAILATASSDHTARLWRAVSVPQADPLRLLLSSSADGAVTLRWRPLASAVGYNVYRRSGDQGGPSNRRPGFVKLNTGPLTQAIFTDESRDLVTGRPWTYGVAALFPAAADQTVQGPLVTLQAIPVVPPSGFIGCSINESPRSGSVVFHSDTNEITLRGAGEDIFSVADGFYFLTQAVEGNYELTVTALTRPTETHEWAQAGLMIRESLEAGARHACLMVNAAQGVQFKWRATANDETSFREVMPHATLSLPITLRLTRRGDTIAAEYSRDGGTSFRSAGDPVQFGGALSKRVYAGLAITAHDSSQITEAKFKGLEIQKR